ncbi:NAD-dependent epimerase/dehydratase [Mycolicibacterium phlei]|uniref:Epimerase n=1 Tax=Mycolicibacterium phlei DSM 43239 = CCUG 21000 TaxID=1226750 RepID=A0A5N5UPG5_MYCPH|nr:NAD-dependent epimerase/dehydratase family protein [Mycolicibacterium phlei]VEG08743.1 NAD-dependent epimerase/dehydratase [Mycobacteroides chelonae]AMO60625.1 UDP-glucose 4-epimerase [Mycolicibacterium phlei]EID13263.1 NAD-dependent epimerase/dehydratase [Mycolicibacterium phlei RIVM601174]KAB7751494.1 epimerase [Mycolicibacterium phlei DSM 43239 = CCUG 21000]KXW68135.1 epimerase [Mycolicibacterium phlei DSM 43239 = CCUG 21000]
MVNKLVIGASGFLGSHVTRQLAARGDDVRVLLRPTSSTRGIDGLDVDIRRGDVFDPDCLREAMRGCDVVYYCVVDARPWLLDPTPLWRTNVDGLRTVLDVAATADLHRFVFTSTIGTIGRRTDAPADETTAHNWLDIGGDYIRSRVAAEEMVLRYSAEKGLPAVAMCVANTYGPGDWLPTPHGGLLAAAVRGKMPFYIDGYESETVGIEDAARALLLAGERGRVGERYIVSERWMSSREIFETGCAAVGVEPPQRRVPIRLMAAASYPSSWVARLRGRETKLTPLNIRLMHIMSPLDHSKAVRELGWQPAPTPDAVAAAARFFVEVADKTRKVAR